MNIYSRGHFVFLGWLILYHYFQELFNTQVPVHYHDDVMKSREHTLLHIAVFHYREIADIDIVKYKIFSILLQSQPCIKDVKPSMAKITTMAMPTILIVP